jgi:hypothetical protein
MTDRMAEIAERNEIARLVRATVRARREMVRDGRGRAAVNASVSVTVQRAGSFASGRSGGGPVSGSVR